MTLAADRFSSYEETNRTVPLGFPQELEAADNGTG